MKSEETIHLLLDYTARKLDRESATALEQHMLECRDCAVFREGHGEVWQALDVWQPQPVSPDFNRRLWQRIQAEEASPWYSLPNVRRLAGHLRVPAWKPGLSFAAVLLAVGGGFLLDHPRFGKAPRTGAGETAGGAGPVQVSVDDADKVARTLDDILLLNQFEPAALEPAASQRKM